jgi:hypothetical protein
MIPGLTAGEYSDIMVLLLEINQEEKMKRITAAAIALLIAVLPMTGCHHADGKPDAVSSKTAEEHKSENCEEAYTSMFNATYSQNGGEVCLSYMYPKIVLDHLKSIGKYKELVDNCNTSHNAPLPNMKHIPEITKVNETVKLTDVQLAAASKFFVSIAADVGVGLDPKGINITDGYEIHYEFIDQNGKADKDENECVVYIENDGWKVIPYSAKALESISG